MKTRPILLVAAFAVAVVLVTRSLDITAADGRQGEGVLAQAPLNLGGSITPAFMMAVDDSGSMTFETLFPGRDGYACWSNNSFYDASGNLRTSGSCNYHHLIPHSGSRYRIGTNRYAIPPIDEFGFARSPETNPQYFNPFDEVTYKPWKNNGGLGDYPAASVAATRVDPRDNSPTINLFATREEVGSGQERFRVRSGMVIPAGTRYYEVTNCDGLAGGTGTWRSQTYDQTITSTACDIGIGYYPAVFYLRTGTPAPTGFRTANRVLAEDACGNGCDMYRYEIKAANYTSTDAYNAAAQKFSNWFSYYGNRNRSMIAGMTSSLADVNNMRIGFFRINSHGSYDNPASEFVTMRDMTASADRVSLYDDIIALPASGSTPNRQAVNAAASQFQRTDGNAPIKLACQKNAVMLFTDGYSNQNTPDVGGNIDGNMGAPFADGHSNTMADIVSRYYLDAADGGLAPLRTGAAFPAGRVRTPDECSLGTPDQRLDCQDNLHINFYGITLGARGDIYDPDVERDPFTAPYPAWPSAQNDNPSTVDDIWHATVNTRGEYINARTPVEITEAMRRVLASVSGGGGPSGSIGLSGARISGRTISVVPTYAARNNNTDWYSTLTGQSAAINPTTNAVVFTTRWEASGLLPTSGRNILFGKNSTGTVNPTVLPFSAGNLGAEPYDALCSNVGRALCSKSLIETRLGITSDVAVAYLAGNPGREVRNGGELRDRTTRLGDIINSSPAVSSARDNYGYSALFGTDPSDVDPYNYADYMDAKSTRPTMVYVGANDGMLHGFNGDTGQESFAYIPSTAVGHMGNLLFPYNAEDRNDQKFQHRYFVDGPVTVSDARIGGSWATVLVGTSGAGGRSVFGIDVTTPGAVNSSSVRWEISDTVTATSNGIQVGSQIGHVLGKPAVVPVKTAGGGVSWKAIFGNGYGSDRGRATLFVVDMATGTASTIEAVETAGPGVPTEPNGLGNIIVLDRQLYSGGTFSTGSDGFADTVYAGDLHGNIWKFDITSTAGSIAFGGQPFFTAKDADGKRQPVTGGLEAVAGPANGVMILFGTGSFWFTADAANDDIQSVYGVVDKGVRVTADRTVALQQQVLRNVGADEDVREITPAVVNFASKSGWFMDLAVQFGTDDPVKRGERMVGRPRIQAGTLFFPTYEPDSSDECATAGENWLYALNALTGAPDMDSVRPGSPDADALPSGSAASKLDTDAESPVMDVVTLASPPLADLPADASDEDLDDYLDKTCDLIVQAAGSEPLYQIRACGRQSWRQIR